MRVDLEYPFRLDELCNIFHCPTPSVYSAVIDNVTTNSVDAAKGSLFLAIATEKDDGHRYIGDAVKRGATAILCQEKADNCPPDVMQFVVPSTVEGLGKLASHYKNLFSPKTVAITGSVGKTTTKSFLAHLLKGRFSVHSTAENFNNHIGVPMTVLGMPKGTEILLLELGMNHRGEIGYLSNMVKPDTGIITAIGHAHVGMLGSKNAIYEAKLEITQGMDKGNLLLPDSMPYYPRQNGIKLQLCGTTEKADYRLIYDNDGKTAVVLPKGRKIDITESKNILPSRMASLYGIAVCHILGCSPEEIEAKLPSCSMPESRLQDMYIGNIHLIDDAYNASPESMEEALRYTANCGIGCRITALIGDMLELGDMTEQCHIAVGKQMADLGFDEVWLVGKYAEMTKEGATEGGLPSQQIHIYGDVSACLTDMAKSLRPNDTLLIKGSHANGLSAVPKMLAPLLGKELS